MGQEYHSPHKTAPGRGGTPTTRRAGRDRGLGGWNAEGVADADIVEIEDVDGKVIPECRALGHRLASFAGDLAVCKEVW